MRPATLAGRAVGWYQTTARDLPWRRSGTSAWGVLVSEVMLQQTPVARVVPVWCQWLDRWPRPAELAAVPPGEAIRAWGRLGYPRRALRLHECARALVARHGGDVPADLPALLALPGVGGYTARAVAAFAFGQRHPVVDTNVRRLVARAVTGRAAGGAGTTAADLARVAALLPRSPAQASRASAAMMELGALVCTARSPGCDRCPVADLCAWRRAARHDPDGGRPASDSGQARPSQRYAGTDRQVRGLILALARSAIGPVSLATVDAAWPDAGQRRRALTGLVKDGLLEERHPDRYALPGLH